MTAPTLFETPFGNFELQRFPARNPEPLQAWCAADALLLEALHRQDVPCEELLVVNDAHGALCIPASPRAMWTDSALAATAVRQNEKRNHRGGTACVWATDEPPAGVTAVAMRIPRQLAYFEYQLATLARLLSPGTTLFAAGMDKHLSPRAASLIEHHFGPTQRHRGERKARLFIAQRDHSEVPGSDYGASYDCAAAGGELYSGPNVFSQDDIDIGSRFLLSHLHELAPADVLLDLACGNGILGLGAVHAGLAGRVIFCDESAWAVESARRNVNTLYPDAAGRFDFIHADGCTGYTGTPPDLVLCNPPFHLDSAVDDFAGQRLLRQCAHILAPGGRLCLVANRHLDYRPSLRREFTNLRQSAQNRKFRLLLATSD